jgi:monoamine oxidase
MSVSELLNKDHASPAAIRFFGGSGSALQAVWHNAILKRRGVPLFPRGIYRLKGGNHLLPETFAGRLGERLRLACPIIGIEHGGSGVTVRYRESGKERLLEADYLVCCMSAVMLRQIPVSPAWPTEKRWAIENMPYYTATRPVFQARTKFWKEDGTTASIVFNEPALEHIWSQAEDVDTSRGLIAGTAQGGVKAEAALASRVPTAVYREIREHRAHHGDRLVTGPLGHGLRNDQLQAGRTAPVLAAHHRAGGPHLLRGRLL